MNRYLLLLLFLNQLIPNTKAQFTCTSNFNRIIYCGYTTQSGKEDYINALSNALKAFKTSPYPNDKAEICTDLSFFKDLSGFDGALRFPLPSKYNNGRNLGLHFDFTPCSSRVGESEMVKVTLWVDKPTSSDPFILFYGPVAPDPSEFGALMKILWMHLDEVLRGPDIKERLNVCIGSEHEKVGQSCYRYFTDQLLLSDSFATRYYTIAVTHDEKTIHNDPRRVEIQNVTVGEVTKLSIGKESKDFFDPNVNIDITSKNTRDQLKQSIINFWKKFLKQN